MPTLDDLPVVRGCPLVGNALQFRRDRLGFLAQAARDHGDAVRFRIGPVQVVLLSHPDAVRDVLTVRQSAFRKGPVLQRAKAVLGEGLLTSEGAEHLRDRRMLQAAFHKGMVGGYADTMLEIADGVVRTWQPDRPLDVHAETVRTTLTVAGRTLFGTDVAADVEAVSDALDDLLSAYGILMLPLGRHLVRLPPARRRLRRGIDVLDRLTDRLVTQPRAGKEPTGDDLLSLLVEQGDVRRARDHIVTMLLAGHETTANALAFACHLLATHERIQNEVAGEVLAVCGPAGRPAPEDVDRLLSVRAVLMEALRLFPPSWAMGREALQRTAVGGVEVPAGTVVALSQWVVHRDARWWPDPNSFDPSRFRSDAPFRPRFAYFPFGGGTRQCIGEGFAWTEGVLTLATILARWRLRPVQGHEPRLEPLLTLRSQDGVWVIPSTRKT
jgi:cytochrome P450